MKKAILAMGLTVLISTGFCFSASAEKEYLFWDFSKTAQQYNGLKLTQKDGIAQIEDETVKISYSSGNAPEIHFLLNQEYKAIDTSAVIEFDYKSEAESVNLYLQNSPNGGSVFRLKQNSKTSLRATYEESVGAGKNINTVIKNDLVQGQWYNIKFILDYQQQKCSVIIDNEPVLENVCLFYNSVGLSPEFYDVLIGPDKPGTVYIDNLAVYQTDSVAAFLNVRSELLDVPQTAEENLELLTSLRDDIVVEWESSDETVIDNEGNVTFPSLGEGDKTIELKATLSKDGVSVERVYSVLVPARMSDEEAIELAKQTISFAEKIYDECLLPAYAENDVSIEWSTDRTDIFNISSFETDGFYKATTMRADEDITLDITATFSRGTKSESQTYPVTIAKYITDKMCVDEDIALLQLPLTVNANFSLPEKGINGSDITWTSKNEEYLKINGSEAEIVQRDTVDKEVILVAKAVKGQESAEREVCVIVEKDIEGNTALLNEAVKMLELGNTTSVTSDIDLPLSGMHSTVISWSSSDESIITSTGKIKRASGSRSANLTATVTKGTLSDKKVFRITVAAKVSASGGGGGGSSSGGTRVSSSVSLPSSKIPVKDNTPMEIEPKFKDVQSDNWAFDYVQTLASRGISDGDEYGKFNPDRFVSREEFVKMLVLALHGKSEYSNQSEFSDVNPQAWYAKYVFTACEKGYISGMGDGKFGTGEYVLREHIALILKRVIGVSSDKAPEYTDSQEISDYALEAVAAVSEAGIINGDEEGNFRPKHPATRAETAKLICEVMNIMEESNK